MKKNQVKLILCFIFLNVSIYLSVTVNLNFLFLLFNGLLVYIFYEFDKKKSQNKDLIKGKKSNQPI